MLRSELCNFCDAYIVVKGTITVTNPDHNAYCKNLAFKNNAPFVVMPMYNLLEYIKNYSKTTESFWNYHKDEPNSGANNNMNY